MFDSFPDTASHRYSDGASCYLLAQCQESHHFQGLSDIGDLLAQSLSAALSVHLHELVLGNHLLEVAEGGLDLLAGGNVVANIVDERCDGNSARVGLCCYRAVWRGQFLFFSIDVGRGFDKGVEGRHMRILAAIEI
jgi:hypothetical protein